MRDGRHSSEMGFLKADCEGPEEGSLVGVEDAGIRGIGPGVVDMDGTVWEWACCSWDSNAEAGVMLTTTQGHDCG